MSSTGIEHPFAEFIKSAILQPVPLDHGTIKCVLMSCIEIPYSSLAATSAFHVSVCVHGWMNMIHCSIVNDQFSGSTFACPFPLVGNHSGRAAFGAEPITLPVAYVIDLLAFIRAADASRNAARSWAFCGLYPACHFLQIPLNSVSICSSATE